MMPEKTSCCPDKTDCNSAGAAALASGINFTSPLLIEIKEVSATLSRNDQWGAVKCRLTSFRNKYTVTPGLYAVGRPSDNSDVFVSANYKLSFDKLRSALPGKDAWILALDTKGINVWCAAGKGT
ncbi:MAG: hypothetical protein L7F77_01295, partial [Candidatus Magnetominusculus sp. LBB02]|nr:hypothetical protein [Candidatus Magnetominusculus sp. LBB02]